MQKSKGDTAVEIKSLENRIDALHHNTTFQDSQLWRKIESVERSNQRSSYSQNSPSLSVLETTSTSLSILQERVKVVEDRIRQISGDYVKRSSRIDSIDKFKEMIVTDFRQQLNTYNERLEVYDHKLQAIKKPIELKLIEQDLRDLKEQLQTKTYHRFRNTYFDSFLNDSLSVLFKNLKITNILECFALTTKVTAKPMYYISLRNLIYESPTSRNSVYMNPDEIQSMQLRISSLERRLSTSYTSYVNVTLNQLKTDFNKTDFYVRRLGEQLAEISKDQQKFENRLRKLQKEFRDKVFKI